MTDAGAGAAEVSGTSAGSTASPFRDVPEAFPVISRSTEFRGHVWNIASEKFEYNEHVLTREFVDHTGAVAVLALDEDDRAMFIRQYRHPARVREWELPAGLLDEPGEDGLVAAKRELAEEVDLEAREWHVLIDFFTSPGGSTESIRIYVARGLSATAEPFAREHEEADIEPRWVQLDEAVEAVMRGDLHNPSTVIAVLAAAKAKERGWADLRPADSPWPTRPAGPEAR